MAEIDSQRFIDELRALTNIDGVSGHEGAVVAYLREQMEPLAERVTVDSMGNLYARRGGGDEPHLLISAHSDEIGALVAAVEPDGFLRLQPVGGTPEAMLVGRRVRVGGHRGVVGVRPGHLVPLNERRTAPEMRDLYVDLGLDSASEVAVLGVRVGDGIVWESELQPTANPSRIAGKAIDNRVSCLILLELLRSLRGQEIAGTLTTAVAVQEEVGLKGAKVVAERVRPDAALVIDTVPSADTPDSRGVRGFPVRLGGGPVLQVASGERSRGYLMPALLRDYLVELAVEAGIPYQVVAFPYGNTDAGSIYATGVPTAVATIPRRYSHSPVELLDVGDALATLRLCQEVVARAGDFPRGIL